MSIMKCEVKAILAVSDDNIIGVKDASGFRLPWHIPEDLKFFKQLTENKNVLMGRATWESLPSQFRPLPNRCNFVMTRNRDYKARGANVVHSVDDVKHLDDLWVIGGKEIYDMFRPWTGYVYYTRVKTQVRDNPEFQGCSFITAPDYEGFLACESSQVKCDPKTNIKFYHELCVNI